MTVIGSNYACLAARFVWNFNDEALKFSTEARRPVKDKEPGRARALADHGRGHAVDEDGGGRARDRPTVFSVRLWPVDHVQLHSLRIGLPNITVCFRSGSTPTIALYPKIGWYLRQQELGCRVGQWPMRSSDRRNRLTVVE